LRLLSNEAGYLGWKIVECFQKLLLNFGAKCTNWLAVDRTPFALLISDGESWTAVADFA